jgi:transposase
MTLMDQEGQTIRAGRVGNVRVEIEKFLEGLEAVEAVIETGRSSYTMVDVLDEMGVSVKIAHPHEVKAIARAKIKTDKRDSAEDALGAGSGSGREETAGGVAENLSAFRDKDRGVGGAGREAL